MCRYGTNTYKSHYACFECRKTFKRRLLVDIDRDTANSENIFEKQEYKCPECGEMMANMGLDFESPKKNDLKVWNHMKDLYKTGVTFHSCGCTGPGYIPKDKTALIAFLNKQKENYIKHLRFWLTRLESKKEEIRKSDKNGSFLWNLPNEFETGTKKKREIDLEKAVNYWTEKVNEIDKNINDL